MSTVAILLLPTLLVLSSCGKSGSSPATATTQAATVPNCSIGQVYTSQGCLQAYPGMQGYGVNASGQPVSGGQCWAGTTMTAYGCQNSSSVQNGTYSGTSGYGYNPYPTQSTTSNPGWQWTCYTNGVCCNGYGACQPY